MGHSYLSAGPFLLLKVIMHPLELLGRLALGQAFSGFHHLHEELWIVQGLSFLRALHASLLQLHHHRPVKGQRALESPALTWDSDRPCCMPDLQHYHILGTLQGTLQGRVGRVDHGGVLGRLVLFSLQSKTLRRANAGAHSIEQILGARDLPTGLTWDALAYLSGCRLFCSLRKALSNKGPSTSKPSCSLQAHSLSV